MQQIVKNRSGTLVKEAAYDDRGQYASWNLPGSFSEGSGCLPNLSWARLGRTWAAFGQLLDALGCVLGTFWKLHGRSGLPPGSRGCLQPRFWTSLVPPGWVLESSIGCFRHCFWPCLSRVATVSMYCMNCCVAQHDIVQHRASISHDMSWKTPFASFLNTLGRVWALMGGSGLDLGGSLISPVWVLESSSCSFRHGFGSCLVPVATDSK